LLCLHHMMQNELLHVISFPFIVCLVPHLPRSPPPLRTRLMLIAGCSRANSLWRIRRVRWIYKRLQCVPDICSRIPSVDTARHRSNMLLTGMLQNYIIHLFLILSCYLSQTRVCENSTISRDNPMSHPPHGSYIRRRQQRSWKGLS
jgi:hypothetical protein